MNVFGNNVLIEKLEIEKSSKLILPYESRIPLSWGIIKGIGDEVKSDELEVGDKVMYVTGATTQVEGIKDMTISPAYIYAKEVLC